MPLVLAAVVAEEVVDGREAGADAAVAQHAEPAAAEPAPGAPPAADVAPVIDVAPAADAAPAANVEPAASHADDSHAERVPVLEPVLDASTGSE